MRSPGTFLYDGLDYHDLVTAEEKALGGIGQLFVVFGTVEVFSLRTLGGSPVAGFNEDFAYDPIGNRVSSTDYDETGAARTSLYTANSLNQYTARAVPGWASVRGLADADATAAAPGAVLDVLPPSARPRGNAPRGGDVRGQAPHRPRGDGSFPRAVAVEGLLRLRPRGCRLRDVMVQYRQKERRS